MELDLETMAYRAILKLKKAHADRQLEGTALVLSKCPADNPLFDKIANIYEEEFMHVKALSEELKKV